MRFMLNLKCRPGILWGALAGVALVILSMAMGSSTPRARLAVRMVCQTNDVLGAQWSVFSITNSGTSTAVLHGYYRLHGRRDYQLNRLSRFLSSETLLSPGTERLVVVLTPEGEGEWRIAFGCLTYDGEARRSRWVNRLNPHLRKLVPRRWGYAPWFEVRSNWVD